MIRIAQLYLSAGHNYFGRHGQSPGEHPMLSVPSAECVAGRGLRGDRFFNFKSDYKGQVTFFAGEIYDELCITFEVRDRAPSAFRRNVVTRGIDLNTLIDREFTIQGVCFFGTSECTPCHWMNAAFAPGTEAALKGRGGLRAKILSDGMLYAESHPDFQSRTAPGRSFAPSQDVRPASV